MKKSLICSALKGVGGRNKNDKIKYKHLRKKLQICLKHQVYETAEHIMMNCNKYDTERENIMEKIEQKYRKNDIKHNRRGHGMNSIIYPDFGGVAESHMRKAVLDFIKEAKIKL